MARGKAAARPARRILYPRAWLVLALVALMSLGLLLWSTEGRSDGVWDAGALDGFSLASSAIGGGDVKGLAQALSEESLSRYEVELPDGAQDEVPFPVDALCSASSGGVVVGFTFEGGASSAFDHLRAEMEGRGWTYVSSGSQSAASFVKDVGMYRWATMTCTEVGGGAAVVINARGCDG